MKVLIQSYNNGTTSWNAEAQETNAVSYRVSHGFREPAGVYITVKDPDGTRAQKYNADANDVYIGAAKVTIEDPDDTDYFIGRLIRADVVVTESTREVTLFCEDWLSQFDDEQVTYDMREALDSNGLRKSDISSDVDGTCTPTREDGAGGIYYLYDDDIENFDADEFNGMYLVFPNDNVGEITITTGPYAHTVVGTTTAGSYADTWLDDTNFHDMTRNGASMTCDYDFHINAELGSLYVSGPSRGKIYLSLICYNDISDAFDLHIKVKSAAEAYTIIKTVPNTQSSTGLVKFAIDIPESLLSGFVDTAGEVTIQLLAENGAGNVYLDVYYCLMELKYVVSGTSSAYTITDTTTNTIATATDLTYDGLGLWEGANYCVAQEIYKHIDTAEGGTLVSDGDTMVAITSAATIEHTAGISTRQYKAQTRLAILQDLAEQDKAEFWMALASTTLNWKSTWNDGTADETLSDTDVLSWKTEYDWKKVFNKATVYGMRIGDEEIQESYSDATSIAKFKATRTKVIRETGIVSAYDALTRATAIVGQVANPQWVITATIRGNTGTAAHPKTIVLGDEIQITSTYLGLSSAWYVVQRFEYDSKNHITTLLLHPRVSQTGLVKEDFTNAEQATSNFRRGGTQDKYIPPPATDTV